MILWTNAIILKPKAINTMSAKGVIDAAITATKEAGRPVKNPYPRNSAEYRFWQDGERVAMQEIEEEEENA